MADDAQDPKAPKAPNPYRVKLSVWLERNDYADLLEALEDVGMDSVVPALCTEGCEVEPDGKCEHGCIALTRAAGVI